MKVVKKNLLDITEGILGHGTNCCRAMGSGIAGQLRDKYPVIYERYKELYTKYTPNFDALGYSQLVEITPNRFYIANIHTQVYFGKRAPFSGICHCDYSALLIGLKQTLEFGKLKNLPVYIPKIGAGLGGGNWEIIKLIIQDVEKYVGYELTVCVNND